MNPLILSPACFEAFKPFCKLLSCSLEDQYGLRLKGQHLLNTISSFLGYKDYNQLIYGCKGKTGKIRTLEEICNHLTTDLAQLAGIEVIKARALLDVVRADLSNMNPHRKLLVLGLNHVLENNLISLDWDKKTKLESGYVIAELAGETSAINWSDASFGEISFSVWWKYDHSKHPQANLTGNMKERFESSAPLANDIHYKKFVGAISSGWIERDTGKYLQGKANRGFQSKYIRRADLQEIKAMPNPVPKGFKAEGQFHF